MPSAEPAPEGKQPNIIGALDLLRSGRLSAVSVTAAGYSSVNEVIKAVANHFKLPRIELDTIELDLSLARYIPRGVAEKRHIVAVYASDEEISIATADPTQLEFFDWIGSELRRTVTVVVSSPHEIDRAIRRIYDPAAAAAEEEPEEDVSAEALQQATHIVDHIITGAIDCQASDIHIEAGERETAIRLRVDGTLRVFETYPIELHAATVSRIKVLAHLDISIRHIPQDGRIKLQHRRGVVDLRISVLPTFFGEKVVCRILDNTRACLPLDELGFDKQQLMAFRRMINVPYGLLLVTGPTGSGKSTTLYGALNAVASSEINIVSVEDPVEYQLPGINQVQVNVKRGLTFAGALRSILRQDPDVVLVGEIRDHETGVIAAEAALTGHLVMASLHTNDAASSITRLTEMGIESYLVAPALVGVIAQRLMRRVCTLCAEEYHPTVTERDLLGVPTLPTDVKFKKAVGCSECMGTGYKGRTAVRELLEMDDTLRALIARGALTDDIREYARTTNFKSMRFAALKRLFAGETTTREVMRITR